MYVVIVHQPTTKIVTNLETRRAAGVAGIHMIRRSLRSITTNEPAQSGGLEVESVISGLILNSLEVFEIQVRDLRLQGV